MAKKNGRLNTSKLIELINKKAGETLAYDLTKDNPTEVKQWIPTGSTWLNKIICIGNTNAGIPVGKVTELAGLESSGKSFMAAQIAANAQKMGFQVVYFDSESAISPGFLEQAGCDLGGVAYVQAKSVEYVFETMEELIGELDEGVVFIWDSVAQTPTRKMLDEDFDPQSSIGYKARLLSKAMKKITIPLANSQSTLLALNQLKTNITTDRASLLTEPYVTPGGKALPYSYSLRIWLTARKAKASYVTNVHGYKVGSEVKARIKKSRFGSLGRECTFKILWGNDVGIQDEERNRRHDIDAAIKKPLSDTHTTRKEKKELLREIFVEDSYEECEAFLENTFGKDIVTSRSQCSKNVVADVMKEGALKQARQSKKGKARRYNIRHADAPSSNPDFKASWDKAPHLHNKYFVVYEAGVRPQTVVKKANSFYGEGAEVLNSRQQTLTLGI